MLKNYLKVAWRTLLRNKFFTVLNIMGLALGMTFSLLIYLWIQDERSIDAFHKNDAQLFIVYEKIYSNNVPEGDYETPGILADELKRSIAGVEYAASVTSDNDEATFRLGDKVVKQQGIFAGADFFKMFSYPLIQGTPEIAIKDVNSIAISKKMADLFFSSPADAVGNILLFENKKNFMVRAVFEDLPENTSRKFDYVIGWESFLEDNAWAKSWSNSGPLTYLMLKKNVDVRVVKKQITRFLDKYTNPESEANRIELGLQKFSDVYLHSNFENGEIQGGRIEYINLFSIVSLFIIMIACINFMNLSTALSIKRSREIGVRKVVGANRINLIFQFIGESLLLTTFSIIISLILLLFLLPVFNQITQKQIVYPFGNLSFWTALFSLLVVTGLISGSYPSLFLSSFNPLKVLKANFKIGDKAIIFRKSLVIAQFVLSIILITSTIVISKQINYIQKRNLGYDKENLIYIPLEGNLLLNYSTFKNEALQKSGVQSITRIAHNPTNLSSSTSSVSWEGKNKDDGISIVQTAVGYDFASTMKLSFREGRDFSRSFITDSTAYIINESAAKLMGYDKPIGRPLTVRFHNGAIIGVLKDFHFKSLQDPIEPLILSFGEEYAYGYAVVRTKPGQTKAALENLESLCKELNPAFPFTYTFADEEYQNLYKNEQMIGKLSSSFAFLAIFITCLGLLGLSILSSQQRVKEISVRKVLGASVFSLFCLLSKEFVYLVLAGFLIASPVAWFLLYNWLKNFAYHTTLDWWVFASSGVIVLVIAMLIVSYQSMKSALQNPIISLKSD
jgi:ABC-type antimicrobial peptide transport system permease subunit